MTIDHLGIFTTPEVFEATLAFYLVVLEPLGYKKMVSILDGKAVGLGATKPDFWISSRTVEGGNQTSSSKAHFAFTADDRKTVDQCYAKGIENGGKDNGKPGLRPHYHENYYGGFLVDPAGNTMEVVNHYQAS
ncbi:glyoxalase/bleomycin resistance protein/dioxygenase [Aulographum hederae CBS 113979]|uniref:Glyoxalase/bleomycin resistance protein/dioxygenase n=1 Tax=Aulographum hederae CBS 113979 TaxID=1176131 RepID=A0A6G1H914_9PEZI|nr:glyoxalase/bleomycin resistance protein/dioxygenase [Aulographum hederae CBS 113979]